MSRPLLIDLYCGAGGASMGYHQAGFDVIGIDKKPQRNYPFTFVRGDALTVLRYVRQADAYAASPPCQYGTSGAKKWGTQHRHENLIPVTREALQATGRPFVIENVEDNLADLVDPVLLCGEMFDLGVFRHRGFEAGNGFTIYQPGHPEHRGQIGDGRYVTVTGKPGGRSVRDGIQHGRKADWERAMGIDWMTAREMAQAIPPAMTEFIGVQLLAHLGAEVTS